MRALPLILPLLSVGTRAGAQPEPEPTCQSRIADFALKNAKPQHRLVLPLTGNQDALTPLWEAASGPNAESTFFPIDRAIFVLTIQIRVVQPALTQEGLKAWAGKICDTGARHGARYNGALAILANDIIDADMSTLPTR